MTRPHMNDNQAFRYESDANGVIPPMKTRFQELSRELTDFLSIPEHEIKRDIRRLGVNTADEIYSVLRGGQLAGRDHFAAAHRINGSTIFYTHAVLDDMSLTGASTIFSNQNIGLDSYFGGAAIIPAVAKRDEIVELSDNLHYGTGVDDFGSSIDDGERRDSLRKSAFGNLH